MGTSRSSKAKSGAGAGAGAGSGKSSGGDGYDSSSSDSSGTWGEGGATTGQPNWLLLSVIVNLLLVGACVETYVTRMSVGEVVERLESVIDVQLEKKLVTPEQYAIIIDSFVRGLPGVDLPPQSTSTPLDSLYQKYLEDAGLNPEVAEALSNDEVTLAEELVGQHQKRLNGDKKQASGSGSSGGGAAAAAATASAPATPATPAPAGPLATLTINGEAKPIHSLPGEGVNATAARVCAENVMEISDCARVAKMLTDVVKQMGVDVAEPKLRFVEPAPDQTLPYSGSLQINVASSAGAMQGCVSLDSRRHHQGQSLWCGELPTPQPLSMPANGLSAGMHMLVVQPANKSLSPDVTFVELTPPGVTMTQLGMTRVVLELVGATLDNARVCVHVDGRAAGPFIECVPSNAAPVTTASGALELTVDFAKPLLNGEHVISGLVLSPTGRIVARTLEKAFTVSGSQDPAPSAKHSLQWLTKLADFDMGVGSKNGEDGLIEALARRFGLWNGDYRIKHGYFVEMDVRDRYECATRFLENIFSWTGVRFSSLAQSVSASAAPMYKAKFTSANINDLLQRSKVQRDIDVLVITGVTSVYHLWNAFDADARRPRFVVLETNPAFPPPDARTVAESEAPWDGVTDRYGASLQALVLASRAKGYSLVYVDVTGERAMFVRDELLHAAAAAAGEAQVGADGAPAPSPLPAGVTTESLYRKPNVFRSGGGYQASKSADGWLRVVPAAQ